MAEQKYQMTYESKSTDVQLKTDSNPSNVSTVLGIPPTEKNDCEKTCLLRERERVPSGYTPTKTVKQVAV